MDKPFILSLKLIILALLVGCNKPAPTIHTNQLTGPIGESSTEATISDPSQLKAWHQFNKENRYRIASADDFKFSNSNKPNHPRHWFASGDFNRDHRFPDFALIIVDVRQENELRFGLIIFNARGDGYEDPIWLYSGSDLSRTSLNYSSHGPLLITEHYAELTKVCTVKWNPDQEQYTCN